METVLEVKNLTVAFSRDRGEKVVTDRISFSVGKGEILCIVGESGCGKSVTSLAVMGLLPGNGRIREGEVIFDGRDLTGLSMRELDAVRGKDLAMIYQDALSSLNPVFTIGRQMMEPLLVHLHLDRKTARMRAVELLRQTEIPDAEAVMKKYPHELSGGMRQRVMIAMALACGPKLLIADEPTTALDVTVQAQIMQLLLKIRKQMDMSIILITHDIGLVAQMADRVLVMYAGQIIEEAEVHALFVGPRHPYTRALLSSVPEIFDEGNRRLASIEGSVPEDYAGIAGCRFADRCPEALSCCREPQPLFTVRPAHLVRCCRAGSHDSDRKERNC